jgi:hypothetical protein
LKKERRSEAQTRQVTKTTGKSSAKTNVQRQDFIVMKNKKGIKDKISSNLVTPLY